MKTRKRKPAPKRVPLKKGYKLRQGRQQGIGGALLTLGKNIASGKKLGSGALKGVLRAGVTPGSGISAGAGLAGELLKKSKKPGLQKLGNVASAAGNIAGMVTGGGGGGGLGKLAKGAMGALTGGGGGAAGGLGALAKGAMGALGGGGAAAGGGGGGALAGLAKGALGALTGADGMRVPMENGGKVSKRRKPAGISSVGYTLGEMDDLDKMKSMFKDAGGMDTQEGRGIAAKARALQDKIPLGEVYERYPDEFGESPESQARGGVVNYNEGGLVGGQKKLDKNNDGKISGDDFKMLRSMMEGGVVDYEHGGEVDYGQGGMVNYQAGGAVPVDPGAGGSAPVQPAPQGGGAPPAPAPDPSAAAGADPAAAAAGAATPPAGGAAPAPGGGGGGLFGGKGGGGFGKRLLKGVLTGGMSEVGRALKKQGSGGLVSYQAGGAIPVDPAAAAAAPAAGAAPNPAAGAAPDPTAGAAPAAPGGAAPGAAAPAPGGAAGAKKGGLGGFLKKALNPAAAIAEKLGAKPGGAVSKILNPLQMLKKGQDGMRVSMENGGRTGSQKELMVKQQLRKDLDWNDFKEGDKLNETRLDFITQGFSDEEKQMFSDLHDQGMINHQDMKHSLRRMQPLSAESFKKQFFKDPGGEMNAGNLKRTLRDGFIFKKDEIGDESIRKAGKTSPGGQKVKSNIPQIGYDMDYKPEQYEDDVVIDPLKSKGPELIKQDLAERSVMGEEKYIPEFNRGEEVEEEVKEDVADSGLGYYDARGEVSTRSDRTGTGLDMPTQSDAGLYGEDKRPMAMGGRVPMSMLPMNSRERLMQALEGDRKRLRMLRKR